MNVFIPNIGSVNQGIIPPSSGFPFTIEILYEQEVDGEIKQDTILFEDVARHPRFSMFSFSRNNYVVIDSDATKNEYGEIEDISNFIKAKHYIRDKIIQKIEQSNHNNSAMPQIGIWYKEGKIDIPTIESYLDDDSENIKGSTKKLRALKIVETWSESQKKLSDFKAGLSDEIELLYNMIAGWNNECVNQVVDVKEN